MPASTRSELNEEEREVVAGLPPLDSLGKDSDFTPFLRDGVPEFLQKRALRVLWRVNPFFNFRDGLNEYDDDYNVIHKIIDSTFGSYKVGRGHLSEKELQDMMPEEARRAFDDDAAEDAEVTDDAEAEAAEPLADEPKKALKTIENRPRTGIPKRLKLMMNLGMERMTRTHNPNFFVALSD